MSFSSIALLLAAAPRTAAEPFVEMRAIVAPVLACERAFDKERRKLTDETRRINTMPQESVNDQELWNKAYADHNVIESEFKSRRHAACKGEVTFELLKSRLTRMRPDLTPNEVHQFALGFFHDLRRTAEYAADFSAGYDSNQYTPPSAPPSSRGKARN